MYSYLDIEWVHCRPQQGIEYIVYKLVWIMGYIVYCGLRECVVHRPPHDSGLNLHFNGLRPLVHAFSTVL